MSSFNITAINEDFDDVCQQYEARIAELLAENAKLRAGRVTMLPVVKRPDLEFPPEYYEPTEEVAELEAEVAALRALTENQLPWIESQEQLAELMAAEERNAHLEGELAIYKRALELACELLEPADSPAAWLGLTPNERVSHFIKQAQKEE